MSSAPQVYLIEPNHAGFQTVDFNEDCLKKWFPNGYHETLYGDRKGKYLAVCFDKKKCEPFINPNPSAKVFVKLIEKQRTRNFVIMRKEFSDGESDLESDFRVVSMDMNEADVITFIQQFMSSQDDGVYVGEIKDGKYHGQGKCIYSDGSEYEGEFQFGEWHGLGKFTDKVSMYEGKWKNGDIYQGRQTLHHNGDVYEGQFCEDWMRHGEGKLIEKDGNVFEGKWDSNNIYEGKYISVEGLVYVGEFKDQQFHGKGKLTNASGAILEGEWKNGAFQT